MRLNEKTRWNAERKCYENFAFSMMGYKINVVEIPDDEDELGYTSANNTIHLKYYHQQFMKDMSPELQAFFRKGVFIHELLHKIFSDFSLLKREVKKQKINGNVFLRVFCSINNALEDMAIEYFAPLVIGGNWLKALRYTIRTIYDCTPKLEAQPTPFGQFEAALIQFGDMGLLKVDFTFPEARDAFVKCADIFFKGSRSSNPEERMQAALIVTEIARPLWDVEEDMIDDLLNNISKICDENSLNRLPGTENQDDCNKDIQPDYSELSNSEMPEPMQKVLEKLKKEMSNNTDDSDDNAEQGESEDSTEDSTEESTASKSTSGSDDLNKSDANSNDVGEDMKETEIFDGDSGKESQGNDATSDSSEESNTESSSKSDANGDFELNPANGLSSEDYEPTEEELSESQHAIDRFMDTEREISISKTPYEIPNITVDMGRQPNTSKNTMMPAGDASVYMQFVSKHKTLIGTLTKQFKTLLKNNEDDVERCNAGSINLKRYISRPSGRIFDRRRAASDTKDVAVFISIDESGSMSQDEKDIMAKQTCIILTEALQGAGIPVYVMGFTADINANADHQHYVTWNTKNNASMLDIHARANNYDGLSLRYAHNILQKRPETHKIMMVISDGCPQCNSYGSRDKGIIDTQNAVKEIRKDCTLFSIGIGSEGAELQRIYTKDFINITHAKELSGGVIKKIKSILKNID